MINTLFLIIGFIYYFILFLLAIVGMTLACCISVSVLMLTGLGFYKGITKLFPQLKLVDEKKEVIPMPDCCGKYVQQQTEKVETLSWITWLFIWLR